MVLLNRKPGLRKLAARLKRIEKQLQHMENDEKYLPSPADMEAIKRMRGALPCLGVYMGELEKKLDERISVWRNTPYTKAQLLGNNIVDFIGWWLLASVVISQFMLNFWWLFPELWQLIVAVAASGLVLAVAIVAGK